MTDSIDLTDNRVPRFTGKTPITGKTAEIPERPKNNRELKYDINLTKFMPSNVLTCLWRKAFCMFIANIFVSF